MPLTPPRLVNDFQRAPSGRQNRKPGPRRYLLFWKVERNSPRLGRIYIDDEGR